MLTKTNFQRSLFALLYRLVVHRRILQPLVMWWFETQTQQGLPPPQNERTTFGCKCACALPYLPRPVSFGAISKLNSTPCWCSILGPTTTLPKELPDFSAHKTALELWFTPFSGPKLRRKCTTRKEKEGRGWWWVETQMHISILYFSLLKWLKLIFA